MYIVLIAGHSYVKEEEIEKKNIISDYSVAFWQLRLLIGTLKMRQIYCYIFIENTRTKKCFSRTRKLVDIKVCSKEKK